MKPALESDVSSLDGILHALYEVHVLSKYESLRDPNGPPFEHGANSMQLFYDDSRWWVVSIMWNTSRSS
jgi:hypothetical protein